VSPTLTNADHQHPDAPYPVNWELQTIDRIFLRELRPLLARRASVRTGTSTVDSLRIDFSGFPEGGDLVFLERNPWFYIPAPDDLPNILFLDTFYKELNYTQQNQGWAVLVTDGDLFQILHVIDARQSTKVGYTLSSKSTRLTFAEDVFSEVFPLRN